MQFANVSDIYIANRAIRVGFDAVLNDLSPDETAAVPDGETWSIRHVVEHVALVEDGISRICGKLVAEAIAAGTVRGEAPLMSPAAAEKMAGARDKVLEAPDRVQPSGSQSIAESLASMDRSAAAFDAMKDDMDAVDLSGHTFPHPHFGGLTAAEWLILVGGHEARHLRQIQRLLEAIRK